MAGSIAGFSVNVIDAGWCNELHQSTDFLIIGICTNPIIERYANSLSALSKLLNELWREINPKYIINNIKVEVILASHSHQVPHVGMPQIEPETKAINVIVAPIGAIDLER